MDEPGEDRPDLPREFICLTSTEDMKRPRQLEPILTWDAAVGKDQLWMRDCKIEEGVFHGRVGRAGSRSLPTKRLGRRGGQHSGAGGTVRCPTRLFVAWKNIG